VIVKGREGRRLKIGGERSRRRVIRIVASEGSVFVLGWEEGAD